MAKLRNKSRVRPVNRRMKGGKLLTKAEIEASIDRMVERMRKEAELRCPYCDYVHEGEETYDYISYYGSEEGPQECECSRCGMTFYVEEIVARTYECVREEDTK